MTTSGFFVLCLLLQAPAVDPTHFFGGTITARPFDNTQTTGPISMIIRERWSWLRSRYTSPICTDSTIAAETAYIGDSNSVNCVNNCGAHWPTNSLMVPTWCTDFNVGLDTSSGEFYDTFSLPVNIAFSIGFTGSNWLDQIGLGPAFPIGWRVVSRIYTFVRPDGRLNTSPVAVSLPIIYKEVNIPHVHVIQMSDFDGTDILACRWATALGNINSCDECGGICHSLPAGLPTATLIGTNCTMSFTLTTVSWYYGVALQIEDFYDETANTTNSPMASVPLQFLFYASPTSNGSCLPPEIIGDRPNRACIGVMANDSITTRVVVQVNCAGTSIVSFISTVPRGVQKSPISNPTTNRFEITLSWIPRDDQYGPQSICMAAIDDTEAQSNQWCITYLVGFKSPDVIRPNIVQGSASPIGTIFQNHTFFSIQTNKFVNRPTRNGTFIKFVDTTAGNSLVQQFDCGWAPEVTYTGYTIVVRFSVAPWIPGHFYHVEMEYGVVAGVEFCGPESDQITDPTFWVFNIWDPAVSSTTTTTTTPPTTVTATTRPISTTSTNPLLTTTGISVTNATAYITTSTTTTTVSTTTGGSTTIGMTTTAVTTESTVAVLYPKDLELACLQPIAITNVVLMVIMMPIHALVMYAAFTKFSNMFQPANINARTRHKQRMKRIMS